MPASGIDPARADNVASDRAEEAVPARHLRQLSTRPSDHARQLGTRRRQGRLSSATLMRRLRSNSRKDRIYKVFREVGRSVRTVALLRYLADPQLRARITAATNKVESYDGFAQWLSFGTADRAGGPFQIRGYETLSTRS